MRHDPNSQFLHGRISFTARWNPEIQKLEVHAESDSKHRNSEYFIEDEYRILISTNSKKFIHDHRDVYIIGDRPRIIANRHKLEIEDLHLTYISNTSSVYKCCLLQGEPSLANKPLNEFIDEAIIPFLYRLSYLSKHGIEKTKINLWDDYSHFNEGRKEYLAKNREIADELRKLNKNDQCHCGSGRKFKRCCIEELKAYDRIFAACENIENPYPLGKADKSTEENTLSPK